MPFISRRVVEGTEQVVVSVEHRFTAEEVVLTVMAVKISVRPKPGVRVVPLSMSEVRAALVYAARHGLPHHVADRLIEEEPGGPMHLLADWVRAELVRLNVFTREATMSQRG